MPAAPRAEMVNGGTTIQQGIYQVTVMSPKDSGKFGAINMANAVRDHFRAQRRLSKDGTTVTISTVVIGPPLITGDRFALPVSINWLAPIR